MANPGTWASKGNDPPHDVWGPSKSANEISPRPKAGAMRSSLWINTPRKRKISSSEFVNH